MRYVRIYADERGKSRFEEVVVDGHERHIVGGLPPLLLSGPYAASEIVFVEQPPDAADWSYHVAPRRQWVIVLSGCLAVTVSTGEKREFGPGEFALVEDLTGDGHLTTPLTRDLMFAMVPTGDA